MLINCVYIGKERKFWGFLLFGKGKGNLKQNQERQKQIGNSPMFGFFN